MRYSLKILHVPGKEKNSADTLSRVATCTSKPFDIQFIEEGGTFGSSTKEHLPATAQRLREKRKAEISDEECM